MKKIYWCFFFLLFLVVACNPHKGEKEEAGESDIEAATSFIQAALRGNFKDAGEYMLQDSANEERLDAVSRIPRSSAEKQGLWDASINIHNRHLVNDSTSIIIYSNSFYKDNKDTLRVIKQNGRWLVDFKYLFDQSQ